jgi:hypothetical protein
MAALQADVNSVDGHRDGIRWDLYLRVGAVPPACAFVIRLCRFCRRPKTVDAYARNLDRFLAWFDESRAKRWLEADEGDLLAYFDDLGHGLVPGISAGLKHVLPRNCLCALPATFTTTALDRRRLRWFAAPPGRAATEGRPPSPVRPASGLLVPSFLPSWHTSAGPIDYRASPRLYPFLATELRR